VLLATLLALSAGCAPPPPADTATKVAAVARPLDSVRNDPGRRLAFLRELPKGGDLHNHLSGSVTTETLIRFAADDGLCAPTSATWSPPTAQPGVPPALDASSKATAEW
jgi:adenosine deaminase